MDKANDKLPGLKSVREIVESFDERKLREVAELYCIKLGGQTGSDAVNAFCEQLLEKPLRMFFLCGTFSERIWSKVLKTMGGEPQVIDHEDWTEKAKVEDADMLFSFLRYVFPALSFSKAGGRSGGYRIAATVEAAEFWRSGGEKSVLTLRAHYDDIFRTAKAAANLYGVFGMTEFGELCRHYFGDVDGYFNESVSMGFMLDLRAKLEVSDFFVVELKEIVHSAIHDDNGKLRRLRAAQRKLTPWMPREHDEFVRFADEKEFESEPAVERFVSLLRLSGPAPADDKIVRGIVSDWRQGVGDDLTLRLVANFAPKTTRADTELVLQILSDIRNRSRTWEYFGHTAEELGRCARIERQDTVPVEILRQLKDAGQVSKFGMPPVKFGRNDPCPCGSGKKYKKCCGKANYL